MNQFQNAPTIRYSEFLESLRSNIEQAPSKLSLHQVISFFGPKSHALLTLFFVLPFLQPIPIPGLSTVLGTCAAIVGFDLLIDRAPWLPARLGRVHVEKRFLLRVTTALERLLRKVEHLARPRGEALIERASVRRLNGALLMWHALLLALPLPIPLSNFIPASCLALIALGSLEDDFAMLLLGYVSAVVNLAFFVGLVAAPYAVGHLLRG